MLASLPAVSSTSLWSEHYVYTATGGFIYFLTTIFLLIYLACACMFHINSIHTIRYNFSGAPHIPVLNGIFLKFSLQIGFLLSVPRLPSMAEKEDFEIEGLDFMVCFLVLFILFVNSCAAILCLLLVSMWTSFCQRSVCTTAAREPKS